MKWMSSITMLVLLSGFATLYLAVALIFSLVYSINQISAFVQTGSNVVAPVMETILFCVYAGTLGSSVMALRSIIERIANGWELSDGTKFPKEKPEDKFVAKMVPGFLVRPFLGSAMGFLVYLAVTGGFWIAISPASSSIEFNPFGLGFLSFLAGLFAKTFLKKLKWVFDHIFGSDSKVQS